MEQTFTKLKNIRPSAEFQARSKMLILSSQQNQPKPFALADLFPEIMRSSFAFGLSALMIFMMVGGLSLFNQKFVSPKVLSALDANSLKNEIEGMDIQIQIAQVKYYEASAKKVEVALNETSGDIFENSTDENLRALLNDYNL
mgnify:FL=1